MLASIPANSLNQVFSRLLNPAHLSRSETALNSFTPIQATKRADFRRNGVAHALVRLATYASVTEAKQPCHRTAQPDSTLQPSTMNDFENLQAAVVHLSVALRLLDSIGGSIAGAQIDMALHDLKRELEMRPRSRDLREYHDVDFSILEAAAVNRQIIP